MASVKRPSGLDGFVAELTAMTAADSSVETYQSWASTYEADMLEGYGYSAHRIAVDALAQACPDRTSTIIDLGCGTGLVAVELAARGYSHIDGLDGSEEMLSEARQKGVYRELRCGDLTAPDALTPASYDAAIAVGVFGGGHVGPGKLACFAAPVRAGGVVVLYANGIPFIEDDYAGHLHRLEEAGLWQVEKSESSNYMDKIERPGWVVVARRAGATAYD